MLVVAAEKQMQVAAARIERPLVREGARNRARDGGFLGARADQEVRFYCGELHARLGKKRA